MWPYAQLHFAGISTRQHRYDVQFKADRTTLVVLFPVALKYFMILSTYLLTVHSVLYDLHGTPGRPDITLFARDNSPSEV